MKEKEKIKIICDDREPKSMDVVAELVGGIEFERKRLKTGDYILGDTCIERKTIDDFCGSIIDGRLVNQVDKMKANFKNNYILVAGKIKDRTSEIHENCILGKMSSIIVKHNISIITLDDEFQLVYLMKRIFERHQENSQVLQGGTEK